MEKYSEPWRVIHAVLPAKIEGEYWALLDCGHATLTDDKFKNVLCGCCGHGASNITYTPKEFRREFSK